LHNFTHRVAVTITWIAASLQAGDKKASAARGMTGPKGFRARK